MKLLVYIVLFYFAYRLFIAPFIEGLNAAKKNDEIKSPPQKEDNNKNGDYIDYEEVE